MRFISPFKAMSRGLVSATTKLAEAAGSERRSALEIVCTAGLGLQCAIGAVLPLIGAREHQFDALADAAATLARLPEDLAPILAVGFKAGDVSFMAASAYLLLTSLWKPKRLDAGLATFGALSVNLLLMAFASQVAAKGGLDAPDLKISPWAQYYGHLILCGVIAALAAIRRLAR